VRPLTLLLLLAGLLTLDRAGLSQDAASPPSTRVWSARWIWTPGDPAPKNAYAHFRKGLTLAAAPREVKAHITADSRYQLWVNGRLAGRGPVRSDRRHLYYDTWDLTPLLRKGGNSLAVLVHHYGETTFQYMQGRGGLLAEFVGFGGQVLAATDATWRTRRSTAWAGGRPRMSIQLGFNEVYDAREAPVGWTEAEFQDAGWEAAVELGPAGMEPWPNLVARDIPKMLERPYPALKVLQAVEVEPEPATQFVDLLPLMEPKEWGAAYLAATVTSPAEREVELRFGSDDALKVWVNGRPVLARLVSRGAAPGQDRVRVSLRKGENRIVAKVVQGHSDWAFYFQLAGAPADGAAAPEWWVAGPFTYPRDDTLKVGFDAVFPPEAALERAPDPAVPFRHQGREVRWRRVAAADRAPEHVSQLMAGGVRRPLERALVKDADHLIRSEGAGCRVTTASGRDVSFLVDFGREVTGYPRFRVRGATGGEIIDMGYGEVLQRPDGAFLSQSQGPEPQLAGNAVGGDARLNPDRDGVHYADRYICRPGNQTFQTFDKRGFRYLQLDVRNAPAGLEIDGVGLVFSTFPVEYRGAFQSSDDRLNRIWEIGRWTNQLNMEDGYTDCPWRERAQWWGDARVEALINYYCFGDTTLIRKALRQKAQSLNDEGMTWGVYPTDWDGGRLPSFTLIWVSTLWETYLYTGDQAILRELFPAVRATLDRFFHPRVGPRGLLKDIPYWVFIDWAPVDDKGEMGSLNAYYYDALRAAAAIARHLGDASAAEYERRAAAVKEALNRRLWDPQARAYRDSLLPDGSLSPKISQQTNSLCVLFDIAPRAEHAAILDFIYDPANKQRPGGLVEAGSPYFSYYQLAALYHAGRHEQALAYIRERWGRMLDWGATTWWETWQPGASFCHGWSGGPTFNLSAEVLGVQPLKPGFAEVAVRPQWLGLAHCSGIVPTAKGDVSVGWQRSARAAAVRVETPEGVPFELTLPGRGSVTVDKKARLPAGVVKLESPPDAQRFRVEKGGEFLFELRD
jgi:alpha-L-rhamnosidase